jgi:hypothetical protein
MWDTLISALLNSPTVTHEPGLSTAYENNPAIFRRVSGRLRDEAQVWHEWCSSRFRRQRRECGFRVQLLLKHVRKTGKANTMAHLPPCSLLRAGFPSRVERTPPVCRSALCSRLLSPFGLESVTVFDPAPLCASPSQKPACGFPAQASSTGPSPNGIHGDQRSWTWKWMSRGIAPETFPRETAPLAAMIEPCEQEFVDCPFKAV